MLQFHLFSLPTRFITKLPKSSITIISSGPPILLPLKTITLPLHIRNRPNQLLFIPLNLIIQLAILTNPPLALMLLLALCVLWLQECAGANTLRVRRPEILRRSRGAELWGGVREE